MAKIQTGYKVTSNEDQAQDFTLDKEEANRTFNYFVEEYGECKMWEIVEEWNNEDETWEMIEENIIRIHETGSAD